MCILLVAKNAKAKYTSFYGGKVSQFISFFIASTGDKNQCDELNAFLKSHVIIRTVENFISNGKNCGIQILVEYKENGDANTKSKRVDYRSLLKTEKEKQIFDKLKKFRAKISKEKKFVGAYMVCKDEHLSKIVQNPKITAEEIANLPNASNIMLKEFAEDLFSEYQKILLEIQNDEEKENEESKIPF